MLQAQLGSRKLWPCTGRRGECQGVVSTRMGGAPDHRTSDSVMLPYVARRAPLLQACRPPARLPKATHHDGLHATLRAIHDPRCLRDTQQTAM